ncbi:hypothetical protein D3H65_12570 [Paraflavitalea soli]|uniref:Lipocalin-like domain-containing protein n=1 Tax=Paraflavitalea soli TaxID=2315862 RepID=A0A3B7MP61_9BACT|nr:hypothetical protein [Paraflavitalea soli]AXY74766.1 hypothetical protein D3H65_12570 [Paraflavitalea soli]
MTIRLLSIVFFMQATTAFAQSDLSGTWALQNKQHVSGPDYANALPKQITINKQADSLIIESVNMGAEGQDVTSKQAVAINGKSVTGVSPSQRRLIRSIKWTEDKKGLILTTVFYRVGNPTEIDFTRIETLSLSADGKQLNIDKKSEETQSETWQVKGVYARK